MMNLQLGKKMKKYFFIKSFVIHNFEIYKTIRFSIQPTIGDVFTQCFIRDTYIHTYFIETPLNRAFQSQCQVLHNPGN